MYPRACMELHGQPRGLFTQHSVKTALSASRGAGCGHQCLPGQPSNCGAPAPDTARLPLAAHEHHSAAAIIASWRARSRPTRPPRRCPKTAADPHRKPPALCWMRRRQPRTHSLVAAAARSTTTTVGIARNARPAGCRPGSSRGRGACSGEYTWR